MAAATASEVPRAAAAPSAAPAAAIAPAPGGWAVDFFLLGAIWGASFLFMRVAVAEFGALPTAALRVAIATAVLVPLMLWRGLGAVFRAHAAKVSAIGVINSALPFVFYAYAVQAISTGLSAILNAATPLFGALIAWLWLGDRLTRVRTAGLALGFAGVAALAWDKAGAGPQGVGAAATWAVAACLGATILYGVAASASRRYLGGVSPLVTATGSQLGATLALAVPAVWLWPAQMPGVRAWLAVIVLGVVCTGWAYVLYFRIIGRAGPARALAVTFIVPVFAVAYGTLLLGEALTGSMLGCGLVIVLGTALSTGLLRAPGRKIRP